MKGIVVVLGCLLSYVISRFIPDGPLAVYASLFISYHLLLGFLVITHMQDKRATLNPINAALTHGGFIVLLLVAGEAGAMVPYFFVWRFLLPALALVEWNALFSKKNAKAAQTADAASDSTAEEYEEFIDYMRGNNRTFSRPGYSIRDEFNSWLAARGRRPQVQAIDAGQQRQQQPAA
jgi:hypothetical protein